MFKNFKVPYLMGALALCCFAGAAEAQVVDFNFSTVNVEENNPSNGDGTGSLVLRFQDVATIDGGITDLLVESTSDYQSSLSNQNGLAGDFGRINLLGGTSTSFQLSLVADGTSTPIDPDSFDSLLLSFVDLDGGPGVESILISEAGSFEAGSEVAFQQTLAGGEFSSITTGNVPNASTTTLNAAQSLVAFEVDIADTSVVDLTLDATGSPSGSGGERGFFFAGSIDFDPGTTLNQGSVEVPFEMESAAGLTLLGLGAALKLRKRK